MHNLPNNQLYCRTLAKTLNSGSLACDLLFTVNRSVYWKHPHKHPVVEDLMILKMCKREQNGYFSISVFLFDGPNRALANVLQ